MNSKIPSSLIEQVKEYILRGWDETVRSTPRDEGTLLALPFPYTVPSRKDTFQELYYWDTYFTSLGLLIQNRNDLAIGNTRNLMSQVERFGFVPNGNRTFYLNRSQFPYLGPLVALVSGATKDPGLPPRPRRFLNGNTFSTPRRDFLRVVYLEVEIKQRERD